jgi:1-acyl-sn-glycerol-3-phosphate acyltransferase
LKIIKRIISPIWKTWFFLVFALSFLVLYPFFWFALSTGRLDLGFKLKRVWSYCIVIGSGIYPRVIFRSASRHMPQPCVFVGNHTSYLDIIVSPFYIDHLALYLGKAELLKAPLFKIFFQKMDIPVNRKSRIDAVRCIKRMEAEIEKGRSMVIFPEGTIPVNTHKTLPFKNGAFKLAIDKQVPIVPVVNVNNYKLLQNGGFFKSFGRPGIAKIIVFDPIPTKGMTEDNLVDLREKVFKIINDTLNEHYGTKD